MEYQLRCKARKSVSSSASQPASKKDSRTDRQIERRKISLGIYPVVNAQVSENVGFCSGRISKYIVFRPAFAQEMVFSIASSSVTNRAEISVTTKSVDA